MHKVRKYGRPKQSKIAGIGSVMGKNLLDTEETAGITGYFQGQKPNSRKENEKLKEMEQNIQELKQSK